MLAYMIFSLRQHDTYQYTYISVKLYLKNYIVMMKKVTVPDSLEVASPVALSFYFEERKLTRYLNFYTHIHILYISIYINCAIRDNREIADGRESSETFSHFYLERIHPLRDE